MFRTAAILKFAVPLLLLATPLLTVAQQDNAIAAPGATGSEVPPPLNAAPAAPARAARLTFFLGSVSVQRSDNTPVADDAAVLNMPLTEGTRVVANDYGQAELEFEDGSVVRLTPRSSISLDSLDFDRSTAKTHLTVLSGLVYFELRKSSGSDYTVSVAGTDVSPLENLTLRVNLDEPPPIFSVLAGSAHLDHGENFQAALHSSETLRPDPKDPTRYFLTAGVTEESWDRWNADRDAQAADDAGSTTTARDKFAGSQGYGWSDLDANGSWYDIPGQGEVWQPRNADENFDPYGYGSWVWSNTGYVYASGYQWGWVPYRCGRWLYIPNFGWAWQPNLYCNSFGYGGFGGDVDVFIYGDGGRFRRRPIGRPIPPPGFPHPTLPVRGPHGLRPPVLIGGPVKVLGKHVEPLRAIGAPAQPTGGNIWARGFSHDYPIDGKTHRPVMGVVRPSPGPGETASPAPVATGGSGSPGRGSRGGPPSGSGAVPIFEPGRGDAGRGDAGRGDAGRSDPGRTDPGRTSPGRGDSGRTDSNRPDRPRPTGEPRPSQPNFPPASGRPAPTSAPAPAPAPVRSAPPPAPPPAPVFHPSSPPPAAPAAPAHTDAQPTRPKQ